MANLGTPRATFAKSNATLGSTPIAAAVQAHAGLLNLVDEDGYYNPDEAVRCLGKVNGPADPAKGMDNRLGAAGALSLTYEIGCMAEYDAHATHPPTIADDGKPGYASDDHTISRLSADGPRAGIIRGVSGTVVEIELDGVVGAGVAATQTVAAADDLVFATGKDVFPLAGDGAPVTLTADFPDVEDGRLIELVGAHATNVVTITTGTNTLLAGGADCPLSLGSRLVLRGDATADAWCEVSRSLNA